MVSYSGKTIPRWGTAAILKIDISPYLSEKSSDFHDVIKKWKSCIGQTPSSTERISCSKTTTLLSSAKCTRPLFQCRTRCGGRPSSWHDIVACQRLVLIVLIRLGRGIQSATEMLPLKRGRCVAHICNCLPSPRLHWQRPIEGR